MASILQSRRSKIIAALFGAVIVIGGVGGIVTGGGGSGSTPGASLATCSPPPCTSATEVSHNIFVPDANTNPLTVTRTYFTYRPTNLTGKAPLLVTLLLNSTDSDEENIAATNKFEVLRIGVVHSGQVAPPTVQPRLTPAPAPKDCGTTGTETCDDVPWIKAAIDETVARDAIDTQRIYVSGPSKGSLLAADLLCDTRTYSYFTGVSLVSEANLVENTVNGTGANSQSTPPFCPSMLGTDRSAGDGIGGVALQQPFKNVSIVWIYGTNDTQACGAANNLVPSCMDIGGTDANGRWVFSNPQEAGDSSPPSSGGATSVGSNVMFGHIMGCGGTPSSVNDSGNGGHITINTYTGCSDNHRATQTIKVVGAGHSWAGVDAIDPTYTEREQLEWDFFSKYGGP